jgi:hypothetical protein
MALDAGAVAWRGDLREVFFGLGSGFLLDLVIGAGWRRCFVGTVGIIGCCMGRTLVGTG